MRLVPEIVVASGAAVLGDADPLTQAHACVRQGATAILLRDIGSGAVAGSVGTTGWLERFIAEMSVPVHLDCSNADPRRIEQIAAQRLGSVILDARLVADPSLLCWALDTLGNRLTVELQGDGPYLFDAPRSLTGTTLDEAVQILDRQGAPRVLYRDMTGDRIPRLYLPAICRVLRGELWLADCVRDLPDVEELTDLDLPGLGGIVVGRPLFDGRLDLAHAQWLLANHRRAA